MRPEDLEELMLTMSQPKVAQSLPDDAENGDDMSRKLLGREIHSGA